MPIRPPIYSRQHIGQRQGLNREPVGGGAPSHPGDAPAYVRERGLTIPATVTSTSQELLPADNDRKFLFIQNNDVLGKVTISFGGAGATLGIGFNLAAGGGAVLLDNNVPNARMFAIGSIASNPNITIITG